MPGIFLASRKLKKSASLTVTALAATLSITTLPSATEASAATASTCNPEIAGGQQISAIGLSQARDRNGNITDAWADGGGNLYVSYRNGSAVRWPTAFTRFTPKVIYTDYGWRVFHTGTDNHVYYAGFEVNSNGTLNLGSWQQVPGSVVPEGAPAVTSLPDPNQTAEQWMLTFRAWDNRIYAQYHLRNSSTTGIGRFDTPVALPNATSQAAPAIAENVPHHLITVAWTGGDGAVYASSQSYGSPTWSSAIRTTPAGTAATQTTPAVAYTGDGQHGQVGGTTTGDPHYFAAPQQLGDGNIIGHTHVTVDLEGRANRDEFVSSDAFSFFALHTYGDDKWCWKDLPEE